MEKQNSILVVHAYLVNRRTGRITIWKKFRGRIPLHVYIKLVAWVFAYKDQYPPETHKLVCYIERGDARQIEAIRGMLEKANITVANQPLIAEEIACYR